MIELQLKLLGDSVRNEKFFDALKKNIKPGTSTVSDIGSGTGFLSFIATRLGARECYLYECEEEILHMSAELARLNGIKNCHFTGGYSQDVRRPVRTDIVISETLGNFALEEHVLETLQDAQRFLQPGGTMIPAMLEQYVSPVTNGRIFNEINVWDRVGYELNFAPAKKSCLNNIFVYKITPNELLDGGKTAQVWDTIHFMKKESSVRNGMVEWKVQKDTTIYGFALWWESELTKGVRLSTSPLTAASHWDQIFMPVAAPFTVKSGEIIRLKVSSDTRFEVGMRVSWDAQVLSPSKKPLHRVTMDTAHGVQ